MSEQDTELGDIQERMELDDILKLYVTPAREPVQSWMSKLGFTRDEKIWEKFFGNDPIERSQKNQYVQFGKDLAANYNPATLFYTLQYFEDDEDHIYSRRKCQLVMNGVFEYYNSRNEKIPVQIWMHNLGFTHSEEFWERHFGNYPIDRWQENEYVQFGKNLAKKCRPATLINTLRYFKDDEDHVHSGRKRQLVMNGVFEYYNSRNKKIPVQIWMYNLGFTRDEEFLERYFGNYPTQQSQENEYVRLGKHLAANCSPATLINTLRYFEDGVHSRSKRQLVMNGVIEYYNSRNDEIPAQVLREQIAFSIRGSTSIHDELAKLEYGGMNRNQWLQAGEYLAANVKPEILRDKLVNDPQNEKYIPQALIDGMTRYYYSLGEKIPEPVANLCGDGRLQEIIKPGRNMTDTEVFQAAHRYGLHIQDPNAIELFEEIIRQTGIERASKILKWSGMKTPLSEKLQTASSKVVLNRIEKYRRAEMEIQQVSVNPELFVDKVSKHAINIQDAAEIYKQISNFSAMQDLSRYGQYVINFITKVEGERVQQEISGLDSNDPNLRYRFENLFQHMNEREIDIMNKLIKRQYPEMRSAMEIAKNFVAAQREIGSIAQINDPGVVGRFERVSKTYNLPDDDLVRLYKSKQFSIAVSDEIAHEPITRIEKKFAEQIASSLNPQDEYLISEFVYRTQYMHTRVAVILYEKIKDHPGMKISSELKPKEQIELASQLFIVLAKCNVPDLPVEFIKLTENMDLEARAIVYGNINHRLAFQDLSRLNPNVRNKILEVEKIRVQQTLQKINSFEINDPNLCDKVVRSMSLMNERERDLLCETIENPELKIEMQKIARYLKAKRMVFATENHDRNIAVVFVEAIRDLGLGNQEAAELYKEIKHKDAFQDLSGLDEGVRNQILEIEDLRVQEVMTELSKLGTDNPALCIKFTNLTDRANTREMNRIYARIKDWSGMQNLSLDEISRVKKAIKELSELGPRNPDSCVKFIELVDQMDTREMIPIYELIKDWQVMRSLSWDEVLEVKNAMTKLLKSGPYNPHSFMTFIDLADRLNDRQLILVYDFIKDWPGMQIKNLSLVDKASLALIVSRIENQRQLPQREQIEAQQRPDAQPELG